MRKIILGTNRKGRKAHKGRKKIWRSLTKRWYKK